MKKHITLTLFFLLSLLKVAYAQTNNADNQSIFASQGMIYVVVVVLTIILLGIFTYLFYMDKKITKIEKQLKNNELSAHKQK